MLQRDYIKRLIREFAEALRRMLDQKEVTKRRESIRQLYEQYLGPYNLYHFATIDELMLAIQSYPEDERLERLAPPGAARQPRAFISQKSEPDHSGNEDVGVLLGPALGQKDVLALPVGPHQVLLRDRLIRAIEVAEEAINVNVQSTPQVAQRLQLSLRGNAVMPVDRLAHPLQRN